MITKEDKKKIGEKVRAEILQIVRQKAAEEHKSLNSYCREKGFSHTALYASKEKVKDFRLGTLIGIAWAIDCNPSDLLIEMGL